MGGGKEEGEEEWEEGEKVRGGEKGEKGRGRRGLLLENDSGISSIIYMSMYSNINWNSSLLWQPC